MDERLINNASFSKICKILQKKESLWKDFKPILQAIMLVVPALVNKDFATAVALNQALDQGLIWIDAGEKIEKAITSIKKLVTHQDEDYITRAENAQIANVLLIFSAYFDTVKLFLPDKDKNIYLDEVKYSLTEKSLKAYQEKLLVKENASIEADGKKIADWDLVLPNPLESLDEYEKRLKEFYYLLNDSFRVYLDGLSCAEELQEHLRGELNRRLEMIPDAAVGNYRAQYYSLAAVCPDFFVWANQQEHQQQRELIDRGFRSLSEQIHSIPEIINEYTANEALTTLKNWYSNRLGDPIIPIKDMPLQDQEMKMPTRENSFVPQAYEWLIYRERISVEATQQWKDGREIGPDILKVLRSPELGSKPVLILGDPGAGKTMLCHMLAGKILCGEYHVIVLHLRDLNAELSIAEQIGQEIANTTDDCDCKWGTIAKAKPKKPVLLIFDGYDELLQASGKTYSNYLEKIVSFQERQWESRAITVRSIVTSRIVLIDKVEIPINSVIIRLKPFDKPRIDKWCEVWNAENEAYFKSRGLKKFEVGEDGKAWELAGEPLLLLMLALFDTKDNALRKHQDLQATELYGSLIRDFVEREKKKNPSFEEKAYKIQKKEIEKEVERISIAALGMYNRNALHITSGQLENDLNLLTSINSGRELRNSEQLLGSFFFIHDVSTRSADIEEKDKLRAYTFLHNTFGEFLAAYYIVFQLYNLLDDLKRHVNKYEDAPFSLKDRTGWYACLSYTPLFHRPVVGQMIREWAPQYFQDKGLAMEDAVDTIKLLLNREIPRLLRGATIFELKTVSGKFQMGENKCEIDLMEHLATYTNNILCLAALLTGGVDLGEIEVLSPGAWNKLLHLWRYAFDENEIAAFAGQFEIKEHNETSFLVALDVMVELQRENDRITKLYKTYKNLQEEPARSILGALMGVESENICTSLRQQEIRTEAKSILLGVILGRANKKQIEKVFLPRESRMLISYLEICLNEGDYGSLYGYFLVLNDIAAFSVKNAKDVASLLRFDLLMEVYSHCCHHHPATTILLLELLEKLLPVINDEDLHRVLERLVFNYNFEYKTLERITKIWANLLLGSPTRVRTRVWLNACWELLRHAERGLNRTTNQYSYETVEKLCLLSFEASKTDPGFPLNFIYESRRWIDKNIMSENMPISMLPVVEILESQQSWKKGSRKYLSLASMLDEFNYRSELSDQSIGVLADLLLKESTQIDTKVWLKACYRLLRSVEQYFYRDQKPCSEKNVEKLILLSWEASKRDAHFPLSFAYEEARKIAIYVERIDHRISKVHTYFIVQRMYTALSILTMTVDMMQTFEHSHVQEEMQLYESVDILLHTMQREGVKLSFVWQESPHTILALCHTLHVYSNEVHAYVLTELAELVSANRSRMTLELYHDLCDVAERFNHLALKHELEHV